MRLSALPDGFYYCARRQQVMIDLTVREARGFET
jgi:hypothetical protein